MLSGPAKKVGIKHKNFVFLFECTWHSFPNNWTSVVFVIGMLHFSRFLFLMNFQWHMHSIFVWNMKKQSESRQTRYDTTYINDSYYVYVFLFSVKKRVLELSRVWPWRWPCEGTPCVVFIRPIFHNTIETCLKRIGHGGCE